MLCINPYIFLDLHHQLARRRDDKDLCATALARLRRQFGKDGKRERRRLARAGLRDTNQVLSSNDRRNGGGLDGRRLRVAGFRDRP